MRDWIKSLTTALLIAVSAVAVGWFSGLGFAAAVREKLVIVVMKQPNGEMEVRR